MDENNNMHTPANDTPTEDFLSYNAGKLEVRDGLVHLLAAGWAEYEPDFAAAGLALRDKMPLAEFKDGVRTSARLALRRNTAQLAAAERQLETPLDDKRFIRQLLEPGKQDQTPPSAFPASAKVIAFPAPARRT